MFSNAAFFGQLAWDHRMRSEFQAFMNTTVGLQLARRFARRESLPKSFDSTARSALCLSAGIGTTSLVQR